LIFEHRVDRFVGQFRAVLGQLVSRFLDSLLAVFVDSLWADLLDSL
jgi:hypothetical protein